MTSSPIATHFPVSPSRESLNTHPYAIKTSSSAVLTRSNSSSNRHNTSHHYAPLSHSKNSPATKQSRYVSTHGRTRSLSSEDVFAKPPPVPMPPSPSVPVGLANQWLRHGQDVVVSDGDGIPTPPMTWRLKRSETLPSVFPNRSDSEISSQDLPKNPKIWTPSQLSVYLSSALRLKGGVKLPLPVTRDIANFVLKEHLSGRAFLRMKTEDYDHLGINQLWKDTLLEASRSLRQNIVQGRIMGFGPGSGLAPKSTEEMSEEGEEEDISTDLPSYNPLETTRRQVSLQWEEDQKRMGKTSFRAGRVRGMVETYERSVSESSASGSDCEGDDDKGTDFDMSNTREMVEEPIEDETGFASGEQSSASEDEVACHDHGSETIVLSHDPSPSDVPSGTALVAKVTDKNAEDDSPSIEELLEQVQDPQAARYQSWGAKAWENEVDNPDEMHITARRIPPSLRGTAQRFAPSEWQNTIARHSTENTRRNLSNIFERPANDLTPNTKTMQDVGVPVEEEPAAKPLAPDVYQVLEAFQRRLEVVEKRLDELERKEETQNVAVAPIEEQPKAEADFRIASVRRNLPRPFNILYSTDSIDGERRVRNYVETDPSVSGLPRYMFLISLGVVAVVTRVVLRRFLEGKKKKWP